MEATTLGLKTKSGLRPYSRYKSSLYTTEAAALKAINRRHKQEYIQDTSYWVGGVES